MTGKDPRDAHQMWKFYGPKQGAECQCSAIFYPEGQTVAAITEAHRFHVWKTTGLWPGTPPQE